MTTLNNVLVSVGWFYICKFIVFIKMNGRKTSNGSNVTSSSRHSSTPSQQNRRRSPKLPIKVVPVEAVIARAAFFAVKGDLHSSLETPAEFSEFLVQMGKLPTKQAVKKFWTNGNENC
jgi:hypothetical protein